ncbi:HlyD family efflux transporter periplasmic adaptor subunit [bacterium]|nr:HlyD family efflux transporter periplasmic adaptor subunit [bacterium]
MTGKATAGTPPTLESLRLLATPAYHRTFFRWTAIVGSIACVALFLPWQQNVQATGEVTALAPADRPQTVNAIVGGRIVSWDVGEGQAVQAGDPIVHLADVKESYLDPRALQRQREALAAKERSIVAKEAKVSALARQIAALRDGLTVSLEKGRNKVAFYESAVSAAVLDSSVAAAQLARQEALYRDGLKSLTELEGARTKALKAYAGAVEKRNEHENARLELRSLGAEYGEKIAKSEAERSNTLADIGESSAEVAKLRSATVNLEARTDLYVVRAPQAGFVVKALKAGVGEMLKDGDAVVTIQPANPSLAVALYVKAMDVPLLRVGHRVRLQFDGWPALQFSGWPSASVGTFGGVIRVVDLVDSKPGKYRVLIVPNPADDAWPAQLRVGSAVYGWAMLDRVRVWYEIWRKLNGFPPTVDPPSAPPNKGEK